VINSATKNKTGDRTSDRYSILIVDDEPDLLWVFGNFLTRTGYTVVTAPNATEALSLVHQHSFALAFIDVKLPDMDGLKLAVAIRDLAPDLPLIVLSGYHYGEDAEIVKGVAEGLYAGFIAKPFDLQEVHDAAQLFCQRNA